MESSLFEVGKLLGPKVLFFFVKTTEKNPETVYLIHSLSFFANFFFPLQFFTSLDHSMLLLLLSDFQVILKDIFNAYKLYSSNITY